MTTPRKYASGTPPEPLTLHYCSDAGEWSAEGPCDPDCSGSDHLQCVIPDATEALLRLIVAVRSAWNEIEGGDSGEAMEDLQEAYMEVTGHEINY